ncbi:MULTISPECIES: hypothetical protein [Streptomyces]|uniref:hypothetical protein n=1 Tax=Streptomyces TaxID=1883 RepID=UPI000A8CEADF|nr:hypothetical protein [Streptomyces sp. SID7805]MYU53892.1 hypothetical protein [Streptomyces sp. SID7805]
MVDGRAGHAGRRRGRLIGPDGSSGLTERCGLTGLCCRIGLRSSFGLIGLIGPIGLVRLVRLVRLV